MLRIFITIIILLAIAYAIITAYKKAKQTRANIKVNVRLHEIKFGQFLEAFSKSTIDIPPLETKVTVIITNSNNFPIPIKNLYIEIFDKNVLIGQTARVSNQRVIVPKNAVKTFIHPLNLYLVKSFFDTIKNIRSGEKVKLNYKLKGSVFGLPVFTHEDTFEFQK